MENKLLINELRENDKLKKQISEELNRDKIKFIDELKKNGSEIKEDPLKVKIKKENVFVKLMKKFFNLF